MKTELLFLALIVTVAIMLAPIAAGAAAAVGYLAGMNRTEVFKIFVNTTLAVCTCVVAFAALAASVAFNVA
jgi:hypothetical protein